MKRSDADYKGMIDHVYVTNTYDDEKPQASRKVVQMFGQRYGRTWSWISFILPNLVIEGWPLYLKTKLRWLMSVIL